MELLHPGVFIREVPSGAQAIEGVSTSTAGFIGKAEKGELDVARLVTSFTQFQAAFGGFTAHAFLAQAAFSFFSNGGRRLYIVRVAKDAKTADVTIKDRQATPKESLTLAANSPGAWPAAIKVTVADGTLDSANEFQLTLDGPTGVLESFDNLSMSPDAPNFVGRVNSLYIKVTVKAVADPTVPRLSLRPAVGTCLLSGAEKKDIVLASTKGDDGAGLLEDGIYTAGFAAFNVVQDVNILAVPGVGAAGVVNFGTDYCFGRQDCFFVGDMASEDDTSAKAQVFVKALASKKSYGAVYFPWVKVVDPTGQSAAPVLFPPSGFVTGIYARIDAQRGVFKAPAGTEASLAGAVGLAGSISDADQDALNPIGANAIRFFTASGIVVWGARTLATKSDPAYRYIPVRRLAIFIEQSIYNGIQWAVFEPNDEPLWSSLRLNIGAFMSNQFRAGAFQGSTPSQAFFVKCDADTNPQSQIDAGIVTVLVGFAPVKPAEFVVIQISQKTAGAAV